jgi:hypothetical protein
MQPQYPNLEYDDARTVVCGADFHNEMNLSTIESGNGHSGSTRPEKINTFAVHCDTLLELNVSMHDDHESAEYGVRTTIRCAGIGNYPIAFIDILEPPRDSWRLQLLREWSHDQDQTVFP